MVEAARRMRKDHAPRASRPVLSRGEAATKTDFRARLARQETILFDGAMGTMLYERGVFLNRSFEEVCLSDPRMVVGIHREYLEAGRGRPHHQQLGRRHSEAARRGSCGEVRTDQRVRRGPRAPGHRRGRAGGDGLRRGLHRSARGARIEPIGTAGGLGGGRALCTAGHAPGRRRRRPAHPGDVRRRAGAGRRGRGPCGAHAPCR